MYQNSRSAGSSSTGGGFRGSNKSRGGYGGGRRSFGRGGGFNRGRSGGRGRYNSGGVKFDLGLLVKKAELVEIAPYENVNVFNDFAIHEKLKANIKNCGYEVPTPIQDQSIPHTLMGRDVVGIANTGTGKTAAFLIPIINKCFIDKDHKVLIIAPTRELAEQIETEFRKFSIGLGIYSTLCIGGANIFGQIQKLRRGSNIVIGTPGRLKDLHQRKNLDLHRFGTIVLDEVDRMLDMGFIIDIKYLISNLAQQRQSLFFTATMSPEVTGVMNSLMVDPITISVKTGTTAKNVDQDVVHVHGRQKVEVLHDLLIQEEFEKVLVFGKTKNGVEKLEMELLERGFKVTSIHGDKRQSQRKRALDMFKRSQVKILLATDVASRGIDVADITHVINYDLPESYEDYVHRIGRTGRINKKGVALSFID
jgi:ATP-dependent RNA helicase RhlE